MLTLNGTQSLRKMSGEELLVQAIFGSSRLKERIDRELDRRTRADTTDVCGEVLHTATPFSSFSGYAA